MAAVCLVGGRAIVGPCKDLGSCVRPRASPFSFCSAFTVFRTSLSLSFAVLAVALCRFLRFVFLSSRNRFRAPQHTNTIAGTIASRHDCISFITGSISGQLVVVTAFFEDTALLFPHPLPVLVAHEGKTRTDNANHEFDEKRLLRPATTTYIILKIDIQYHIPHGWRSLRTRPTYRSRRTNIGALH
jgi:hypothetical protein